ncbi:MAG: ABC transporter ATP-binding protein [Verrucomicrobium sp.]|nr:ABC transporter ATP-binding protein [Verrucomicrobium sp.]
MNEMPLLESRGLGKSYRMGSQPVHVLQGIDAAFPEGSFTTIQGASGSGKTTFLQVLGTLQRPDAGGVYWRGASLEGQGRGRLAAWRNRHVGFIFQSYQLLPEFSALENVDLAARIAGRGDLERSRELLARVGLAERAEHRPGELSGGEQQRVAIARALRNDPDLILADEPTGNLDRETGRQIIELLERLHRDSGKTLILVTHDDEIAARGGHRLRMTGGRLM